jgi:hypothetical protein
MTASISKAEVFRIIDAIRDEPPAATWNDSGATADGWDMACKEIAKAVAKSDKPKFEETFCSSCGRSFGPGNYGYSHCEDHRSAS